MGQEIETVAQSIGKIGKVCFMTVKAGNLQPTGEHFIAEGIYCSYVLTIYNEWLCSTWFQLVQ